MLQRSLLWRQAERVVRPPPARKSPYEVLGVSPNTPFADVKKRYRELARLHHPDMPTGSEHAFREVTAAFHILRAGGAARSAAASSHDAHRKSSAAASNATYRRQHQASEEELKREGTRVQNNYDPNQWFALETLWRTDGLEMLISLCGIVMLGTWTADTTYFSRHRAGYQVRSLENLSQAQQQPAERFQPAPIDSSDSSNGHGGVGRPTSSGDRSDRSKPASLVESLRACRNQHFGTAKDFLYAHDMEGADVRSVAVRKFPVALVDEASIATQCPHRRTFHSDIPSQAYGEPSFVDGLVTDLASTPWANTDAAAAAVLMANALSCVTVMAPSAVKWTVVEYRPLDDDAGAFAKRRGHVGTTECLFALQNAKFNESTGGAGGAARQAMMQRIVITGSESIRYPHIGGRQGASAGEPATASKGVVKGGVIRMHDMAPFQQK